MQINHNHDLFTGELSLANGNNVYFGFEKVTEANKSFWANYTWEAEKLSNICTRFCDHQPPYPNSFSRSFNLEKPQYEVIVEFMKSRGYLSSESHPFFDIPNGAVGMRDLIQKPRLNRYVVYASKDPVQSSHTEKDNVQVVRDKIIMSFGFATRKGSPTVCHFGIFTNLVFLLDPTQTYRGISMNLHGFAAKVALTCYSYFIYDIEDTNVPYDTEKKYMITNPIKSMVNIFCAKLTKDEMHIGTNGDLKNDSHTEARKELLRQYPPIYHIDPKTRIHKIAMTHINLSEHLESLSDDDAEFIAAKDETFDYSAGMTMKAVINLSALSRFYPNSITIPDSEEVHI